VPVSPAEYRLLGEELGRTPALPVTIRVPGTGRRVWRGEITGLPEAEAREVPLALSARGGGPVAVEPGARPDVCVPQAQQYLVTVAFREADPVVVPGSLVRVRVQGRCRSLAWWLWRAVASTFDLGLL
jgi:hypothetical protein